MARRSRENKTSSDSEPPTKVARRTHNELLSQPESQSTPLAQQPASSEVPQEVQELQPPPPRQPDFRVGLDLGTTFTTVAWTLGNDSRAKISTIDTYPDGPKSMAPNKGQVPTELWFRKDGKHKPELVDEDEPEIIDSPGLKFGYEIAHLLGFPPKYIERADYDLPHLVKRVKLLLDRNDYMKKWRRPLKKTLDRLKHDGLISEGSDVLEHAIFYFLNHAKSRLKELHGLKDSSTGKSSALHANIVDHSCSGSHTSCPCLLGPNSQLCHERGT